MTSAESDVTCDTSTGDNERLATGSASVRQWWLECQHQLEGQIQERSEDKVHLSDKAFFSATNSKLEPLMDVVFFRYWEDAKEQTEDQERFINVEQSFRFLDDLVRGNEDVAVTALKDYVTYKLIISAQSKLKASVQTALAEFPEVTKPAAEDALLLAETGELEESIASVVQQMQEDYKKSPFCRRQSASHAFHGWTKSKLTQKEGPHHTITRNDLGRILSVNSDEFNMFCKELGFDPDSFERLQSEMDRRRALQGASGSKASPTNTEAQKNLSAKAVDAGATGNGSKALASDRNIPLQEIPVVDCSGAKPDASAFTLSLTSRSEREDAPATKASPKASPKASSRSNEEAAGGLAGATDDRKEATKVDGSKEKDSKGRKKKDKK